MIGGNKNLRYGTKEHTKILEALNTRKRYSMKKSADRRAIWAKDEERYMAYIKETELDALRSGKRDEGNPQYTTIEIPYSYALLMSAHTYWTTVFLGRTPVFQYDVRHGGNEANPQAMEALLDYQTNIGGMMVPLYIWLMDAPKYGLGVVGSYWDEETVRVSKIVEEPVTWNGFELPGKTKKVRKTVSVPGYQGNRLFNIRPQDHIGDPRVSYANHQKGEFEGYMLDISWNDLVNGKEAGYYYNVDAVKKYMSAGNSGLGSYGIGVDERDRGSSQMELPDREEQEDLSVLDIPHYGYFQGYEMFVRLIPKMWGLGESELPEVWVFTVVDDKIIIRAQPLGELHDKFPIDLLEYEIEGYQFSKRSMLETLQPLQNVMTWLFNTHFYNVRKSLNNMFVADPSRVNTKDITNPDAGLIIRLKPGAYGTSIDNVFRQLPVSDITSRHLQDSEIVAQMMQRVVGVNDQIMGMQAAGGRKTATEIRGSSAFSMNRLKTQAEYFSAMGFQPLGQKLAQMTQQHYSLERMFKIAGDLQPGQTQQMLVTPEDLAGFYDYVPVDGTMPVDRYAMANLFKEIMQGIQQIPQVGMQYDLAAIFAYTMQLAGAKNISRFKVKVTPDQELLMQAQQGNMVPLGPQGGGSSTGGEERFARAGEPGQVPGMGPTG
jgi:hypothetical protein